MSDSVLVIGYGNELRGDDGVGPCVARAIADRNLADVRTIAVHQLVPELTEALSTATLAIFVDAAVNIGDTSILRLEPDAVPAPLGHICTPHELLAMTRVLHGRCPEGWLITIPAVNVDFGTVLSPTTNHTAARALLDIARLIAARNTPISESAPRK